MRRLLALFLLACLAAHGAAQAAALKVGILAARPEPQVMARWQPLAAYLESALGQAVEIRPYDDAGLDAAAAGRTVDMVITSPSQLILLQQTSGLSSPLATLVTRERGHGVSAYGGVIFTLASRADLASLADLAGKRVAAVSLQSFGGYQMQAFEFVEARIPLPAGERLLLTGLPQDLVVEAVLAGRADAGFVRSGVIEALASEGKLDASRLKIINRQNLPAFPDAVSTRLYPEWAVAVLPQIDKHLAGRIAAALLSLPHGSLGGDALVHGFEVAANYDGVQELLQGLRLPPYDRAPDISLADLWDRYAGWMVALAGLLLLLQGASAGLIVLYRRARKSGAAIQALNAALEDERRLFIGGPTVAFKWKASEGWPVEYVSPNIRDQFGYAPEDFTSGRIPFLGIVHPQDAARVLSEAKMHSAAGAACFEQEYRLAHADGGYRWVFDFTVVVRDGAGRVTHFHGHLSDITERKRADEELERYRQRLEELVAVRTRELALARDAAEAANRAKSAFLANMSHELRTPLNAILGFAELMEHDAAMPESQRRNLETINRSGRHLLALINDILEISKIEAGRLSAQTGDCELRELLETIVEAMELRARQGGLELKLNVSGEVPRFIGTDIGKLRQILINLLSNAVKYTRQGGVSVDVSATEMEGHPDRRLLSFVVRDTGVGIAESELESIFQPFYQTDQGARLGEGTGLGLAISRQYAQLLGGELSATSVLNQGSIFTLRLPVTLAETAEPLPRRRHVLGLAAGQAPRRILVVEDKPDNQRLLEQLMAQAGLDTRVAANGEEAVAAFQDWHPDLIWMDMRMPVMDGYEATRRIRALPGGKDVKIAALTASVFREDRGKIVEVGCDEVLTKPVDETQLFAAMERLLDLRLRYAEERAAQEAASQVDLSVLPAPLREALNSAACRLDVEATAEAIAQVREADAGLAEQLDALVRDYNYDRIVALCNPPEECHGQQG